MKKLFTFLILALAVFGANAAGVMICGKVYNENSYQLINQEFTEAGYLKSAIANGDQDGDGFITSGDVTIVYNVLLGN